MANTKGTKGRKRAPENETKADKFKRLGSQRVSKAIKALKQIKALSGAGYESTEEQRKAMFAAIDGAVTDAKTAFSGKKEAAESEFTFE